MADKFYAEIFNHSGASYHRAMQLCPKARDEEFKAALSLLDLRAGQRLLDVPAGGAYLYDYLAEKIHYRALDFAGGFDTKANIGPCSETQLNIDNDSVDKVICLAALHHVQDKLSFFQELHRCLVPSGKLLVGDVVAGSKEAEFLNGFVNQWNGLGHDGDFINFERDARLLKQAGFCSTNVVKHYHWNFSSKRACHDYLKLLFALDKQPSNTALDSAINKLGASESSSGFRLSWSLGFICATTV